MLQSTEVYANVSKGIVAKDEELMRRTGRRIGRRYAR